MLKRTLAYAGAVRPPVVAGRIGLVILLLAVWVWGADAAGPLYVADPITVASRLANPTVYVEHGLYTFRLATVGLLLGILAGAAVGLLLSLSPRILVAAEPFVTASAALPKYALMPLLVVFLGISDAPKVWLVVLLVFYPVFFNVVAGVRSVDSRLLVTARVLGASRLTAARLVVWYSLLPFFFAALAIALPRAMSAAVVGELLSGDEGLGYLIESSRQSFDTAGVMASAIVAVTLVIAATAAVRRAERRALRWRADDHPAMPGSVRPALLGSTARARASTGRCAIPKASSCA